MAVLRKMKDESPKFYLTENEKQALLTIARDSIKENLEEDQYPDTPISISDALNSPMGAFVSIYIDGELRGCIGRINTEDPLYQTVERMAIASASSDSRFSSIRPDELGRMRIEISVLSPLKKIHSPEEIIPGRHGIMIKKDYNSGTFLPQVAQKTGWDAEEMLCQCSERKAGLGRYGWKDAEIYTYEALVFSDRPVHST